MTPNQGAADPSVADVITGTVTPSLSRSVRGGLLEGAEGCGVGSGDYIFHQRFRAPGGLVGRPVLSSSVPFKVTDGG